MRSWASSMSWLHRDIAQDEALGRRWLAFLVDEGEAIEVAGHALLPAVPAAHVEHAELQTNGE